MARKQSFVWSPKIAIRRVLHTGICGRSCEERPGEAQWCLAGPAVAPHSVHPRTAQAQEHMAPSPRRPRREEAFAPPSRSQTARAQHAQQGAGSSYDRNTGGSRTRSQGKQRRGSVSRSAQDTLGRFGE